MDALVVRPVAASRTRALRAAVLRPGLPPAASVYPGDDDDGTHHWAAFVEAAEPVGIASLYREPRAGGRSPGWRLRGMATAPSSRGRGVGRAVLAAALEHVRSTGGGELWCNARLSAVGFYDRAGFRTIGDPFDVPGIGPHMVMVQDVPAAT